MANEKTIMIEFGVPESVYRSLLELSDMKHMPLHQIIGIAVGAGLKSFLPVKRCK